MAAINAQVAVLSSVSTPSSASFQRQLAPARLSFRTFKLRSNGITTKSIRCNVHGGGAALGAQMNLFGRFARIFKSYANAFISMFEDPERMLEQTVLEMNQDLVKMREATAPVLASQKQLENKYKSALKASANWHKKAKVALSKGDEGLAREALKQRKYYDDSASAMKAHLDHQKAIIDNIAINTRHLESKILEAKSKSHTLKARAQSAKLSAKLSETLQNLNPGSALATFESMEHKVLSMEARAVALTQLASDDLQLQGKFASLESLSEDDDLASLKEEMRGPSTISELSQGRNLMVACSGSSPFLHVEIEIEKELIEQ